MISKTLGIAVMIGSLSAQQLMMLLAPMCSCNLTILQMPFWRLDGVQASFQHTSMKDCSVSLLPSQVPSSSWFSFAFAISTFLAGNNWQTLRWLTGNSGYSGLHGANRLASNSLLEGLVFASRAVKPSIAHQEYALKHVGHALHHAAMSADFTGAASATR